jgi:hypothetical protein
MRIKLLVQRRFLGVDPSLMSDNYRDYDQRPYLPPSKYPYPITGPPHPWKKRHRTMKKLR